MNNITPILPGFYPDPSICRVGDLYYMVTSSFEYFPGVPIFKSHDLITWEQIGHCLTRTEQLPLIIHPQKIHHPLYGPNYSLGIYAATLRHHAGKFYMVTTNVTDGRHFIVTTEIPAGEWSDPIWIDDIDGMGFSIDPSLFFDQDGTVYFTSNGTPHGIYQYVIDIETGKRQSPIQRISSSFVARDVEGPHLYHIGEWYYLLTAEGGTGVGHMVAAGRSKNPWGPFDPCPHNPILTHRGTYQYVQATGHADIIEAVDGSWWLVCLGIRPGAYPHVHHIGRETYLTPLVWQNDWFFVQDQQLQPHNKTPVGGVAAHDQPTVEMFSTGKLAHTWNFLRNLEPKYWSLQDRPGYLTLWGNEYTLDELHHAPAFVGRRQQHLTCDIRCTLDFAPTNEHEEAGITVYMNALHHYEIVILGGLQRRMQLRRRIGSLQCVEQDITCPSGSVELCIQATPDEYAFSVIHQGRQIKLGTGETRYLGTEVAGGFTGVYIAMYATGNGQLSANTACFTGFHYIPLFEES